MASSRIVLCTYLSKRGGELCCFTGIVRILVGFSRVSKVRFGIRVSVRIRVSLVLVIGWV